VAGLCPVARLKAPVDTCDVSTRRQKARLASRNADKARELARALPGWEVELLGADEFPPEVGATFRENAFAKARFGRGLAGADEWVLGEDSGIEVDALGGRPGIESARWADDGVARLLEELRGFPAEERGARYVCELVAVSPDGREREARGELSGRISEGPPRGSEGFGYDPIFIPDGETRTVAELGDEWKCEHSHRARAARALREALVDS
jgi:XTP/dITP diphosphohydrolase